MNNKNAESYPDPTASKAIHEADRAPDQIYIGIEEEGGRNENTSKTR